MDTSLLQTVRKTPDSMTLKLKSLQVITETVWWLSYVGYLQRVDELRSGLLNTKPANGREEDLNPPPGRAASYQGDRDLCKFCLAIQTPPF